MKISPRTRNLLGIAITCAMALFLARGLIFKERRTPNQIAQDTFECLLASDTGCVFRAISDEEKKLAGLDSNAVKQVIEQLVLPYWKKQKQVGGPELASASFQGGIAQQYSLANNVRAELSLLTQTVTESGPQVICFSDLLRGTWRAQYEQVHGPITSLDMQSRATFEGLLRDRAFLEGLGMKGLCRMRPDEYGVKFRSFEEIISGMQKKFNWK